MTTPIVRVEKRHAGAARMLESASDWCFDTRNRFYASPRFQRWAAAFPGTRAVARRRASHLFDICAGFVYSQIFLAVVRLRLLEALEGGPQPVERLAVEMNLSEAAARRLLDAAASLDLVERRTRDRYGLGIHGAAYLGNPALASLVEHHEMLYRDLVDPVALLRRRHGTELNRFWSYASRDEAVRDTAAVAAYSTLMAASMSLVAEDILEAYPFRQHRRLLDVGGGEGVFLEAAAALAPELALMLFDLPSVAERARDRIARSPHAARVSVIGGDVFRDLLPEGADLITLVRVIHDHDDEGALAILRAVRDGLAPGGTLLVAEPMSRTPGAEPMGDAYFGFYLLAMGQGKPRTVAEMQALLHEAGFADVSLRKTRRPLLVRVIAARVI